MTTQEEEISLLRKENRQFREENLQLCEEDRQLSRENELLRLRIDYKNLVAANRSDISIKAYSNNRHRSPFALKSEAEMKEIYKKGVLTRQKPVIQYSLQGEKLNQYQSIKEASLATGIQDKNICAALKGKNKTAGGYLWKYSQTKV